MISFTDYMNLQPEATEKCRYEFVCVCVCVHMCACHCAYLSVIFSQFFTANVFAKLLRDDPYGR